MFKKAFQTVISGQSDFILYYLLSLGYGRKLSFLETSALNSMNVEKAFQTVISGQSDFILFYLLNLGYVRK